MNEFSYKPASSEELEREARDWDLRLLTPREWQDAAEAVPRMGPSTAISLRLPTQMLAVLKAFGRRQGVGYQVLLKRWLDDRIQEERDKLAAQQVIKLYKPTVVALAASFAPEKEQVLEPMEATR
ncbi:MAG: hypothetical protein HYY01_07055 [Chloroflexi bacterium]|nr:hypothetical protein [Chloroflexota bacterium]